MRLPNRIMLWAIPVAIAWQTGAVARAQISGHLKDVREFLYPRPHTVNITEQRIFMPIIGVATVCLLISSLVPLSVTVSPSTLVCHTASGNAMPILLQRSLESPGKVFDDFLSYFPTPQWQILVRKLKISLPSLNPVRKYLVSFPNLPHRRFW